MGLGGCAIVEDIKKSQANAREERERAELRKLARAEHAVFRAAGGWKKRTYRNKGLLSQATSDNVSLEISLSEQRGILLVRTAIAMDFPVATGRKSHPTPAGDLPFVVKEKIIHQTFTENFPTPKTPLLLVTRMLAAT